MKANRKTPSLLKVLQYFACSVKLVFLIKNWIAVPLAVFGLLDLRRGYSLHLRSGPVFKIFHYLDILTIKEIFLEDGYKFKNGKNYRTVIDIGANIGAFSIFALLKSPDLKVIAFEPSAKTFRQLRQNIKLNKLDNRVSLINKAVAGKKGKIRLYDAGVSGLRSVYKTRGEKKSELVNVITLREIFTSHRITKCDFLKIDCEGAEYEILFSTTQSLFKKIDRISLEFHEITATRGHDDLLNLLKKMGYKVRYNYHRIEKDIGYIYAQRSHIKS
jgi:FkbM family methyltransferase